MSTTLGHLIASPALLLLRAISGILLAASLVALVALAAVAVGASVGGADWQRTIFTLAMPMILVVAAAVYAWQVMPPRTELVQDLPGNTATPSLVLALLAVLTIAATLQVPAVLASWTESLTLLRTLIGSDSDLLGLNMIPGAVILASPALASLTLLAFVATSILAVGAPPPLVSRALGACVLIQGATAGGHYAIERTVREIAATLQSVMSTPPDPVASAQISDWLARYDRAGGTVGSRLTWLLAGYVLAVVLARVMAPVERVQPPSDPVAHLEQPAPRPVVQARPVMTPAASADFEFDAYSVRPRQAWLEFLVWSHPEYQIASIPPMARARFAFSWRAQTLRRESDGADLLSVRARSNGLLGKRSYEVSDARSGSPIGRLVPNGSDWEIRDASDATLARVVETEKGYASARYVAQADGEDICRFVWGFLGLSVLSAELQIEFLPGAERRVSKAMAIVLGPILEDRARRASRWRSG